MCLFDSLPRQPAHFMLLPVQSRVNSFDEVAGRESKMHKREFVERKIKTFLPGKKEQKLICQQLEICLPSIFVVQS